MYWIFGMRRVILAVACQYECCSDLRKCWEVVHLYESDAAAAADVDSHVVAAVGVHRYSPDWPWNPE